MAEKINVPVDTFVRETLLALENSGLLLVAQGKDGRPNAMTIGWASIGAIWGKPVLMVMVRPSRFTYELMEANGDFTVNVMPEGQQNALNVCGSMSGRDHDKFEECGLTAVPSDVNAPAIAESLISYACRTVMTQDVNPAMLEAGIRNSAYASGDFHRLYFGEIIAVTAESGLKRS